MCKIRKISWKFKIFKLQLSTFNFQLSTLNFQLSNYFTPNSAKPIVSPSTTMRSAHSFT